MDIVSYGITSYLAAALLILFIVHLYRHFTILRRHGFHGPTPLPLVGNLLELLRDVKTFDDVWTKKYGKVFGYYTGYRPTVCVADPEVLKTIMIREFPSFINRPFNNGMPKLFRNGLLFMSGRKWKTTRTILTPAFSAGKLKLFVPIINRCADVLSGNIEKHIGEDVDIRKFFIHFTMDAIASTAFGIDLDSQNQPDDPFVANIDTVFSPPSVIRKVVMIVAFSAPILGKILSKFGIYQYPKKAIDFYERTGQVLIDERKKHKATRIDFIQMLLEADIDISKHENTQNGVSIADTTNGTHKKEVQRLTDDEINGQAFLFFLAGYETTASTLRYAAYTLALHPDIDRKLYDEIVENLGDDKSTYENLVSLKYMDMFLSEVLRFYPPLTRINREAVEDSVVGEWRIPKGTAIAIPIWMIHHNPEYYPDPETFDPERFSADKKRTTSTEGITYLPFGGGPRHCIGMRMALVEMKIALVSILRQVKFVTQVPLDLTYFPLLTPKRPVVVRLEQR